MNRVVVLLAVIAASVVTFDAFASSDSMQACAPGYSPCLPVVGDLNCPDIPDAKKPVRVTGADPYGLDADQDSLGCGTGSDGGGRQSPWGLILRKGKKEATGNVRPGDTLTVVGWSPKSAKGRRYQLCGGAKCVSRSGYVLEGTAPQKFGTWQVTGREALTFVKVSLKVGGRTRASDTVPLR